VEPLLGGSATATLDEVVQRLARAKTVAHVCREYGSAREALLLNGRFVLEQLAACANRAQPASAATAKDKGKRAAGVTAGPFATALEAEVGIKRTSALQWAWRNDER